jgi:quercetin dioxygenase-like cupin family protein
MKATLLLAGAFLALAGPVIAAPSEAVIETPDQMKWQDASQFGKGVQSSVLYGDPSKDGPYATRLKLPADTLVPGHTHPKAENVTVISGSLGLGLGEQMDKSKGKLLPAGSFFRIPADTPHFAWAEGETVVQINGMGPAAIKLVEPATGSSTPSK